MLIIAGYKCDVTYSGQKEALAEFLPLDAQNWITCGNALLFDWLGIGPPVDRFCLVTSDAKLDPAKGGPKIRRRIDAALSSRLESTKQNTREVLSQTPHRFELSTDVDADRVIMIPTVLPERREWLSASFERDAIANVPNFALYDGPVAVCCGAVPLHRGYWSNPIGAARTVSAYQLGTL